MGLYIDNDAKLRVALFQRIDEWQNPYYIGKLQFPGVLNLEKGASFMIFTAEENSEELQIGPIDEERRSKRVRRAAGTRSDGKLAIDMFPSIDGHGKKFYVGEAQCPASIDMTNGIFLAFFNSKEGKEELQISRLVQKRKFENRDRDFDDEHEESYENDNEMPPRLRAGGDYER